MKIEKTNLEKVLITMGELLSEDGESIEGFDNQTLQDLSNVLSLEVQDRLDRMYH